MARFYDADYEAAGRVEDILFYSSLAREVGGRVLEMAAAADGTFCRQPAVATPSTHRFLARHAAGAAGQTVRRARGGQTQGLSHAGGHSQRAVGSRYRLVTARSASRNTCSIRVTDSLAAQRVRHLEPGGLLCFDVLRPDPDLLERPQEESTAIERTLRARRG